MWTSATTDMIITGIGQTLYMTILSTVVGYVFGLPLGVMLAVFDKDGLRPNKAVYKVLDVISNIIRSYNSHWNNSWLFSNGRFRRWRWSWGHCHKIRLLQI